MNNLGDGGEGASNDDVWPKMTSSQKSKIFGWFGFRDFTRNFTKIFLKIYKLRTKIFTINSNQTE